MKIIITLALVLIGFSASAQDLPNYSDSNITLQLTQRAAWYIGFHIKSQSVWNDRLAPAALKNYVGSGNNPDSLFTVTLKAGYIKGLVDLLLGGQNEVVQADRLSIINNSPTVPGGYISLSNQVISKAAGQSSEKLVAQHVLDYYTSRVAAFLSLRNENKNDVIKWANN
jgi:hypothetical protein